MRTLFLLISLLLLLPASPWASSVPRVVVTLKPVHALVASVMAGVGTPDLLLKGGESPHRYALKPSAARALHRADLVVWVGPEMEGFLLRSLTGMKGQWLTLLDTRGIHVLPARRLGRLHDHQAHEHTHAGERDGHLWLDPHNAQVIGRAVAQRLATMDPAHADQYQVNADKLSARIEALDRQIEARIAPLRGRPFVLFHDAFQYFETRYGLHPSAILAVSPERSPGARRVREIRHLIREKGVRCVFAEPQFRARIVDVLVEGSPTRVGVLDPLGADIPAGPDAWFRLLEGIAHQLENCLGEP